MQQPSANDLIELLSADESPCVSLYQPTHRSYPDTQQDPIRYRNALKRVEETLLKKHRRREAQPLLEKLQTLEEDTQFWRHRTEALAVFASPSQFRVYNLQRPVDELVVVAERFHTKPLLRILQSADRFQVLCINREEVQLFEGNRDALDAVELENVPRTLEEALGSETTEAHQTVASYGDGAGAPRAPHGEPAMYHGQGGRKNERQTDRERFFREVDRAILEHHSRPSGLPLILAALPEHHAPFHDASHNPFLLEDGIECDPGSLSEDELRTEAWRAMKPHYEQRLAKRTEDYRTARAQMSASDDLSDIAAAAVDGRVGVAMIEAGRVVPGRIDRSNGRIEQGELADPQVNDLLDELAQLILTRKGEVIIVPSEKMPTESGVAAVYRF